MDRNNIQHQVNAKNKQIKQNGTKQQMADIPLNGSSCKQNEKDIKKQAVKYRQQQQPVQELQQEQERQNEKLADSHRNGENAQDQQQLEKNSQSAKIGCIRRRRQLLQMKIFKFMRDVSEIPQQDTNTQFHKTKFSIKNQREHSYNTQMKMNNDNHKKNEYGKILKNKTESEKQSEQEDEVKDEQTIRRKLFNARSKTQESKIKQRKSSLKLIHSQKQLLLKMDMQKKDKESNISEIQEINQNLNKITQQKIKIRQRIKIVREKYQKSEQQIENLKVFFGHINPKSNLTDMKVEQISQNEEKTQIKNQNSLHQNVQISQQNIEKTVQNKLETNSEKQFLMDSENKTILLQNPKLQLEKQQIKLPSNIRQKFEISLEKLKQLQDKQQNSEIINENYQYEIISSSPKQKKTKIRRKLIKNSQHMKPEQTAFHLQLDKNSQQFTYLQQNPNNDQINPPTTNKQNNEQQIHKIQSIPAQIANSNEKISKPKPKESMQVQVGIQEQHYFMVQQIQQLRIISSQFDRIPEQQHTAADNTD